MTSTAVIGVTLGVVIGVATALMVLILLLRGWRPSLPNIRWEWVVGALVLAPTIWGIRGLISLVSSAKLKTRITPWWTTVEQVNSGMVLLWVVIATLTLWFFIAWRRGHLSTIPGTIYGTGGQVIRNHWKWIAGALALALAVWGLVLWISSARVKAEEEKAKAEAYALAHPPAPAPQQVVPAQRPKTSRTFEVPQEGLRLWLEEGPAIYPKLGVVIHTTPSGRVIHDKPGVDTFAPGSEPYEKAGFYAFFADPPGSVRKVQIYNRW